MPSQSMLGQQPFRHPCCERQGRQIKSPFPQELETLLQRQLAEPTRWSRGSIQGDCSCIPETQVMLVPFQAQGEAAADRSEEHTSELQSLMRISYAVFCLKNKNTTSTRQLEQA